MNYKKQRNKIINAMAKHKPIHPLTLLGISMTMWAIVIIVGVEIFKLFL